MKISIIVPNWNGAIKLEKNLPALLRTVRKNKIDEFIIVDDASTDNSIEVINNFSEVKLIQKKKNSGFASTVNLGVKNSVGEIIILLNSDTQPDINFVSPAVKHFQDQSVFSVGCNVGGFWSGARFDEGYFWHHEAHGSKQEVSSHLTLWASGGSGFFRREIWEELKGFDELYDPFYEEDVDLGYRAVKRGYINIWESESRVSHYSEKGVIEENFPSEQVSRVAQRNQLIFIWKNITSPQLFSQHKQALAKMLFYHPGYWRVFLSALVKLPQILKERKKEKKDQKLTDEEILQGFRYND